MKLPNRGAVSNKCKHIYPDVPEGSILYKCIKCGDWEITPRVIKALYPELVGKANE